MTPNRWGGADDDPFAVEFDLEFPEPDPYLRYSHRSPKVTEALLEIRAQMRAGIAAKKAAAARAAAAQERPAS